MPYVLWALAVASMIGGPLLLVHVLDRATPALHRPPPPPPRSHVHTIAPHYDWASDE